MGSIFHDLIINAPIDKVFDGISTPGGLNTWWTKTSQGNPIAGTVYTLDFGPGYVWEAVVTKCETNAVFEIQFTEANTDWAATKVGFSIKPQKDKTLLSFCHSGWGDTNEDYRFSSFCWAMYLRILKRNIEFSEEVPYEKRLSV